ncbi:MAG: diphosphomevalonate decarboxylase [Candidatus Marsarchaeota archaeon]|jgi:diphosphomevalonate decarboxylase|nr:diphosphomevalonate decarboxylase [Candidatus Marsarchaeota archaeon]MCL5419002.1 diphosphomevalonate decarboxylase [Candidatus Marsarchaeota archaeon]
MLDEVYTAVATPNIALVKYWGKRNDELILPHNTSISITLDETFKTTTSVAFSGKLDRDRFFINGEEQNLDSHEVKERFKVVDEMRRMAGSAEHAVVYSVNSFPTAAGLASSASGISALVFATSKALGLDIGTSRLSIIARQGSGSACRSLMGGFVKWKRGEKDDGSDSYIEQIKGNGYWPDIVAFVAIVSEAKKKVSSRAGMKQTVETSKLYRERPNVAEEHAMELEKAIMEKDFPTLARITMEESNSMHAVMLDTFPPIIYLNDISKEIIHAVHELNSGGNIAAYTFDAGPNAVVVTTEKNKGDVYNALNSIGGIKDIVELKIGSGPRIADRQYEAEINSIIEKNG